MPWGRESGAPWEWTLYDRLGLAITPTHRQESHLASLFLDLDGFKNINDSLGHASGDRVLVELATRVRSSVRAGDTVARFGGNEFIVLLATVTGAHHAPHVAAKVLVAVQAPYRTAQHPGGDRHLRAGAGAVHPSARAHRRAPMDRDRTID